MTRSRLLGVVCGCTIIFVSNVSNASVLTYLQTDRFMSATQTTQNFPSFTCGNTPILSDPLLFAGTVDSTPSCTETETLFAAASLNATTFNPLGFSFAASANTGSNAFAVSTDASAGIIDLYFSISSTTAIAIGMSYDFDQSDIGSTGASLSVSLSESLGIGNIGANLLSLGSVEGTIGSQSEQLILDPGIYYFRSILGARSSATFGAPLNSSLASGGVSLVVTAVPIPTAVWLFGSGLLGLVGMARRKKAA